MIFLWAFQLSLLAKQNPWTLSVLHSSAADCWCISGNMEIYFKNFLLFSVLGEFSDAAVLVHCQGRMRTRTNHVSIWLCVCSGGALGIHCNVCSIVCLRVCMCKHAHIFASVNVCVCPKCWAPVYVCILVNRVCVCVHAAGQGGLVSLWIDTSGPVQAAHGVMW